MTASTRKNNSPIWPDAPSQFLVFAQGEPIVAAELIAFLPNTIRSHDVVFRFASNGYGNKTVETMVDHFRNPSAKGMVDKNTICKMMQKAMRDSGNYKYPFTEVEHGQQKVVLKEWTNGFHKKFNTKDLHGAWNAANLELTGMTPDLSKTDLLIDNVRFDSLAVGVRRFPSVALGDGLNLTRCVQYAVANPHEGLMFPRDFTMLVNRLGRQAIQPHHLDGQVFGRWKAGTSFLAGPLIPGGHGVPTLPSAAHSSVLSHLAASVPVPGSVSAAPSAQPAVMATGPHVAMPLHSLPGVALVHSQRPGILKPANGGISKARKPQTMTPRERDAQLSKLERMDAEFRQYSPPSRNGNQDRHLLTGGVCPSQDSQYPTTMGYSHPQNLQDQLQHDDQLNQFSPGYIFPEDVVMGNEDSDHLWEYFDCSGQASSRDPDVEELHQVLDDCDSGEGNDWYSLSSGKIWPQGGVENASGFCLFPDLPAISFLDPPDSEDSLVPSSSHPASQPPSAYPELNEDGSVPVSGDWPYYDCTCYGHSNA
jgi:hypothetical protein